MTGCVKAYVREYRENQRSQNLEEKSGLVAINDTKNLNIHISPHTQVNIVKVL